MLFEIYEGVGGEVRGGVPILTRGSNYSIIVLSQDLLGCGGKSICLEKERNTILLFEQLKI